MALPVMFRIASVRQLPASPLVPDPHPRKRGGRSKKDITPTGCLSEKLSMFFSNSIANKKGFLPRPARFRGWTGSGGTPGAHHDAGLPNITGFLETATTTGQERATGCFVQRVVTQGAYLSATVSQMAVYPMDITLTAQAANAIYGRSDTVMPASVNLPVIMYLGGQS